MQVKRFCEFFDGVTAKKLAYRMCIYVYNEARHYYINATLITSYFIKIYI